MSWLTMKVLNYRGWPENRHNFLFARFLCLLLEIAYCLIITYACSITSPLPLVPHHFDWQVGPSFCWCSPSTPLVCSCDWPVTCQSLCLQHASMLRDSTVRMSLNVPEEFSSMSDSMFTLFRCFVTDGCVSYEAWLKRDERCWMLLVSADKVGHVSVQKKSSRMAPPYRRSCAVTWASRSSSCTFWLRWVLAYFCSSKIEWDLADGPLGKLLRPFDTQVWCRFSGSC